MVGDGALTGGMCWEALNNIAAAPHRSVLVVLNDNGRSYSPTAGVVGSHLAGVRDGRCAPLFERLGLAYLGPVDGHDTPAVEQALRRARALGAPVVVHCVTRKGRGYPAAEAHEADRMHTVSPSTSDCPSWTDVFGAEMVAPGARRPDLVTVTAAMLHPTGLYPFSRAYPDRLYDVGIAEQDAVTSAAGLAMAGLHPVVCVYATFLNRAFDQVLMDVALHRLPVTFVLDRAGITGSDGPSHNGMWDLSLLGMVPGMRVAAPRDGERGRPALAAAGGPGPGDRRVRVPAGGHSGGQRRGGWLGRRVRAGAARGRVAGAGAYPRPEPALPEPRQARRHARRPGAGRAGHRRRGALSAGCPVRWS